MSVNFNSSKNNTNKYKGKKKHNFESGKRRFKPFFNNDNVVNSSNQNNLPRTGFNNLSSSNKSNPKFIVDLLKNNNNRLNRNFFKKPYTPFFKKRYKNKRFFKFNKFKRTISFSDQLIRRSERFSYFFKRRVVGRNRRRLNFEALSRFFRDVEHNNLRLSAEVKTSYLFSKYKAFLFNRSLNRLKLNRLNGRKKFYKRRRPFRPRFMFFFSKPAYLKRKYSRKLLKKNSVYKYIKDQLIRGRRFSPYDAVQVLNTRKAPIANIHFHHSLARLKRLVYFWKRVPARRRVNLFLSKSFLRRGVLNSKLGLSRKFSKLLSKKERRFLKRVSKIIRKRRNRLLFKNRIRVFDRNRRYPRVDSLLIKRYKYIPDYIKNRFTRFFISRRKQFLVNHRTQRLVLNAITPLDRIHLQRLARKLKKTYFSKKSYRSIRLGSRFNIRANNYRIVRSLFARKNQISSFLFFSLKNKVLGFDKSHLFYNYKKRHKLINRGIDLALPYYSRARYVIRNFTLSKRYKGKEVPMFKNMNAYKLWYSKLFRKLRRFKKSVSPVLYTRRHRRRALIKSIFRGLRRHSHPLVSTYLNPPAVQNENWFDIDSRLNFYRYNPDPRKIPISAAKRKLINSLIVKEGVIKGNNYFSSRFFYNLLNISDFSSRPKSLNSLRAKYAHDLAGYQNHLPGWHDLKLWWRLKGYSHLKLFRSKFGRRLKPSRMLKLSSSKAGFLPGSSNRLLIVLKQVSNNFFVNVVKNGKTLFMLNAGMAGFEGPKRRSWFASYEMGREVAAKLLKRGYRKVNLQVRSDVLSKHVNEALKGLLKTPIRVRKKKRYGKKFVSKYYRIRKLKVDTLTSFYSRSHNGLRIRKARRL